MGLAEFILANVEPILAEWERFARSLAPGSEMDIRALRDHADDILRATARDMASVQTRDQRAEKSKGRGRGGPESVQLDDASKHHAITRLHSGFNLIEVVAEYRALRASVLRLWRDSVRNADENDLEDLTRFNESIDQSLTEAVKSYGERVEESRELFLATLGHDLRNPLNAVVISAGLLAGSEQLDEENRQIAAQMSDFGKIMGRMIDDLLDFTRTRLGAGMPIVRHTVDLQRLARDVVDEFRAGNRDRTFCFEPSGDATGEWDEDRLRQMISNLIANAVDHGDESSSIDVSVRGETLDVVFTVMNQGAPIPVDAVPTLFDPFVRVASPSGRKRNRRVGSIGLGLYIVREVVAAHGGTVAVESTAAAGTRFTVRLPRHPRAV